MNRLLIIVAFVMIACQERQYPTGEEPKNRLKPNELTITKLIIKGEDKSDKLAKIVIADDSWIEYDHNGKQIGGADILKLTNRTVKIKWYMAENGADIGDVTFYDYHILADKMIFTIWVDNSQAGYFESEL